MAGRASIWIFVALLGCSSGAEPAQGPTPAKAAAPEDSEASAAAALAAADELREGDIIFHTSRSTQSAAIALATGSRYTHVGVLLNIEGKLQVFEAVEPVKITALELWTARGEGGHYVVKRLRSEAGSLDQASLDRMRELGIKWLGRHYDLAFDWDDEKIYCSELVWKLYKRGAGIELAPTRTLADFDLTHPKVRSKLKSRYGASIPMDEKVVAPSDLFDSPKLETVRTRTG